MKKLLLLIISILLYADTNQTNINNYYLKILNNTKSGIDITSQNENIIKENKQKIDTYLDTTIYSDIEANQRFKGILIANKGNYLANNIQMQKIQSLRSIFKNKKPKKIVLNVSGYCKVLNDVKVFISDEFSEIYCTLKDYKTNKYLNAKVFVKFVPDYKREMLIAFPIYAEIGNKRFNSVGYFLNATKTSLNVADKIDGVRIKKLLLKGFLVESDIAYKQAMAYLNDLKASRTQTNVTFVQNGDNTIPVQSQKTEKPKARDYINTGIVESVAALIKLLGEDSLYALKPLFYVNRGSVLYTEMILTNSNIFNKMQSIMNEEEKQIKRNNVLYEKDLMQVNGIK